MRSSDFTRVSSSPWLNGFGMKSSAPASIASVFSGPMLDVTMITGSSAVSSFARRVRQTVYPSMPGIITSRSTRSGSCSSTSFSACSPEDAGMTS